MVDSSLYRRGVASLVLIAALVSCGCGGTFSGPQATVTQSISLSLHPKATSVVTLTQPQLFSATVVNDRSNEGVIWSVDGLPGGNNSIGTISPAGLYTPPLTPGTHTVTATSLADTSKNASAQISVTDLPGVFTHHYDLSRDGVNPREYALTTATVNENTFGKLFSCQVDGAASTQPLWVPGQTINGGIHNVVFIATQHDSLYAFDADMSPCQELWHADLVDAAHGGTMGEMPVTWSDVGLGTKDIYPEIGVVGTPVIDPISGTLYVVSKSESSGPVFHQRLHAVDLATGNEKFNAPVNINATISGTGDGSTGGMLSFDPRNENQRSALALVNGIVYVCWASHEDKSPYHGWMLGYNASNVQQQVSVLNTSPNGGLSGIWMSGAAPASDVSGSLYLTTGNGTFDGSQVNFPNNDYGDSLLKVSATNGTEILDYFTPDDQSFLSLGDLDLGSGGVLLLPDQIEGPFVHLALVGGKGGVLYLVDRDNLGHYLPSGNSQIVQSFTAENGLFGVPAFWQNTLYVTGATQSRSDYFRAFSYSPAIGQFNVNPTSVSLHSFPFPGAIPVVSASGNTNGIVWVVDSGCFGVPSPCGNTPSPAVLYAYDAANLGRELWDSSQAPSSRDLAGPAVKFSVPTVANGKVYLGTQGEIDAYGLLP